MTEIELVPQNTANGPIAAAVLACGFGCFVLGVLAVAGDASKNVATALNFYNPTGPLSGVTTVAIALWLVCWAVLAARWKHKTLALAKVSALAFFFLALGLLLTFPPFGDLLLGR
jgi:dipeptide/tripeptide permease